MVKCKKQRLNAITRVDPVRGQQQGQRFLHNGAEEGDKCGFPYLDSYRTQFYGNIGDVERARTRATKEVQIQSSKMPISSDRGCRFKVPKVQAQGDARQCPNFKRKAVRDSAQNSSERGAS